MKRIRSKIIFTAIFFALNSFSQEIPNPGPRSKKEAIHLYDEGLDAFQKQNDSLVILNLKRLNLRYPSFDKITESQRMLGFSYFRSRKSNASLNTQAVQTLNQYLKSLENKKVLSPLDQQQKLEAQIAISHSYQEQNKTVLARTTLDEALKDLSDPSLRSIALLSKADLLLQQDRLKAARATLDAHQQLLELNKIEASDPSQPESLEFQYKLSTCYFTVFPKVPKSKPVRTASERAALQDELDLVTLKEIELCYQETLSRKLDRVRSDIQKQYCRLLSEHARQLQDPTIVKRSASVIERAKETFERLSSQAKTKGVCP
jgi:hypothetical protein